MPEERAGFTDIAGQQSELGNGFAQIRLGDFDAIIASHGLGKTRAAMTATVMLERFGCRALVSAGTAGALQDVSPQDVLVGTRLIQHDYGRSRAAGLIELYRPGVPPLPEYAGSDFAFELPADQRARYQSASGLPGFVRFGTFASGDTFVNDAATRARLIELGANAVDMEAAAVAQVAEAFAVPWLVAKGISDEASAMSHEDFLEGLAEAANRSARVVRSLLKELLPPAT